jgi:DNA-directed RNA polymerase subunit RPC12/RpoP
MKIECPYCDYVYEDKFVKERGARFYKTINGDKPFIKLENIFRSGDSNMMHSRLEEKKIKLYGCPKCKIMFWEEAY